MLDARSPVVVCARPCVLGRVSNASIAFARRLPNQSKDPSHPHPHNNSHAQEEPREQGSQGARQEGDRMGLVAFIKRRWYWYELWTGP